MKIILIVSLLFNAYFLFLIYANKRQINDICRQIDFLRKKDSNMKITLDLNTKELRRLASKINALIDDARQNAAILKRDKKILSETVNNLAHDIRTPLTSLDGYLQLISRSNDEESKKRYTAIMGERLESLKRILDELFTYTKLQDKVLKLEMKPISLTQVIAGSAFSYYEDFKKKGIELVCDIPEEDIMLDAHKGALERLFQNFIKNALVHGTGDLEIKVDVDQKLADEALAASRKRKQVEKGREFDEDILRPIHISFANPCLQPEKIETDKVFDRFYKSDKARSQSSTGLGLAISKELAAKLNGELKASVEGNRFVIDAYFPAAGTVKSEKEEELESSP